MNTNYVQAICGTCKKPINLHRDRQIDGVLSCQYCFYDHQISYNVCPRPYRKPKSRTLIPRTDQDLDPYERHQKRFGTGEGQASGFSTTVAATERFINSERLYGPVYGPTGGL